MKKTATLFTSLLLILFISTATFAQLTSQKIDSLMEDKKGNIWTSSEGYYGQGWVLSRYDGKSLSGKKPIVTEIANKQMIFGLLEDDKGNIWFGADGLYRYDGNIVIDFKDKKNQD